MIRDLVAKFIYYDNFNLSRDDEVFSLLWLKEEEGKGHNQVWGFWGSYTFGLLLAGYGPLQTVISQLPFLVI